jgi:hypothetical protein
VHQHLLHCPARTAPGSGFAILSGSFPIILDGTCPLTDASR